ncbi:MAG: anthranilate synthase component I [Planctomycetes bacterium]|nr:anthranilate synthase component I [Planctomycetota bacterium]MDP6408804.1 chorismate-binding protein [Planctomycetota bacterium]
MTAHLYLSTPAQADAARLVWLDIPSDLLTPVRAFLALRAAGHHLCLLESAEGPNRIARFSFLGVDPTARVRAGEDSAVLSDAGGDERLEGTPQEVMAELVARHAQPLAPAGLPPFRGGWVGWFAYEWAGLIEPTVRRARNDPWGLPLAEFHLYTTVVAFDHATQRAVLLTACPDGAGGFEQAAAALETLAAELGGEPAGDTSFSLHGGEPRCSMTREQFLEGVESLKESIAAGDAFQAVLAQRFEHDFTGDGFSLYRALRLTNPSPHMFFFQGADLTLVGSSPERLVAVEGRRVQNRPIAGTRARSADPDEDDRLAAELLSDRKERAEHDMLVDLARNDLGRVARAGSVLVKEHAALEKFAQVQHLVSRVECELAVNRTPLDALVASFPAGTVSGAPKVKAMDLVAQLEPDTRGPYAGSFGYLDTSGNFDMAITIRTFAIKGSTVSVQAGAGIVFDSDPEREYTETLEKAQALFEALRLADSGAFTAGGGGAR